MKRKVFLMGNVHEVDFANPAAFEGAVSKDLREMLKKDCAVDVSTDEGAKSLTIKIPVTIMDDKFESDTICEEWVWLISGGWCLSPLPHFPGYHYDYNLSEFYETYRAASKKNKASRFKTVEMNRDATGLEMALTF